MKQHIKFVLHRKLKFKIPTVIFPVLSVWNINRFNLFTFFLNKNFSFQVCLWFSVDMPNYKESTNQMLERVVVKELNVEESNVDESNVEESNVEEANVELSERVVLKAQDRILPGFEVETQSSWNSNFFFVQAADTQLGLISNYGDGTIGDQVKSCLIKCFQYWAFLKLNDHFIFGIVTLFNTFIAILYLMWIEKYSEFMIEWLFW